MTLGHWTGLAPSPTLAPSPDLAPLPDIFVIDQTPQILGALGCGDYELRIYPRGLGTRGYLLEGWSALTFETRLRDKSQAVITIPNLGDQSPLCKTAFIAAKKWETEVSVHRRGDGRVWSGPVVQRGVRTGVGTITCYLLDLWLSRRDLLQRHVLTTSDLSDAYAEIWHDAMDRENSAGWLLNVTGKTGLTVGQELKVSPVDHVLADSVASQLASAGLDYVTADRTTYIGPPDTEMLPSQLLDQHVNQWPDMDEDGLLQATRWGVLGQSLGGNKPPPYAEAKVSSKLSGELVIVESDSTVTGTAVAQRRADARIRTYADVVPAISSVVLLPSAPFPLPTLRPGRLIDVRLYNQPVPISGTYRLTRVAVDLQQGASEQVTIEMAPADRIEGG